MRSRRAGRRVSIAPHDCKSRGQAGRPKVRRHRRAHSAQGHRPHRNCSRPPNCCAAPSTPSTSPSRRARAWPWIRARSAELLQRSRHRNHRPGHQPRPQPHRHAVGLARRRGARPAEFRVHGRRLDRRRRSSRGQAGVRPHGVGVVGGGARRCATASDYAGNALTGAPDLFLGATCNPGAERFDAEVENTRRKIDAGAQHAADPGRLSRRSAAALHRRGEARRRRDPRGRDSAQVGKERRRGSMPIYRAWSCPQDMLEAMEQAAKAGVARERGIELAARVVAGSQAVLPGHPHHGHRLGGRSARHPPGCWGAARLTTHAPPVRGCRPRRACRLLPPSDSLPRPHRG